MRNSTLAVGGLLAALAAWGLISDHEKPGQPAKPSVDLYSDAAIASAREASKVALDDLTITNVGMDKTFCLGGDRPGQECWFIGGRVTNHSNKTLRTLVLRGWLGDCPPNRKSDSDCEIVGDDRTEAEYLNIPPGQTREFSTDFWFKNVPAETSSRQRVHAWRLTHPTACKWDSLDQAPWCTDGRGQAQEWK
jgi:hypothetical protein